MSNTISSLSQLINLLNGASKEEYKTIGAGLDIPIEEFLPYAYWSEDHYTRNCIIREENFELILLCWEPDQGTPVHCHGGEECWVYMVHGTIEETQYQISNNKLTITNRMKMTTGQKSFMSDEMGYHRLVNKGTHRTLSLHLYMDPIDDCTTFDKRTNKFIPKALTYHSYQGILESEIV